ncbi:hypothetical protein ABW20_dc0104517 [Dactylellina cionopaga]|nr:hypothetical protein ABW20_dc0104517 [Dactylellina cionopaga]
MSPASPTSPQDDLYVRAPRLYEPPSLAHGEPELPYSPPKRNFSRNKIYQRGASLSRRKRSISVQDPTELVRKGSNTSASGVKRNRSQRGERHSTYSEWVDTLTIIDDQDNGTMREPSTPGLKSPEVHKPHRHSQYLLLPGRNTRNSVKRNASSKQAASPKIKFDTGRNNTAWNNSIIAEQMSAIKYSTKRGKSPSKKEEPKNTEA